MESFAVTDYNVLNSVIESSTQGHSEIDGIKTYAESHFNIAPTQAWQSLKRLLKRGCVVHVSANTYKVTSSGLKLFERAKLRKLKKVLVREKEKNRATLISHLFLDETTADFTLRSPTNSVKVHKSVLAHYNNDLKRKTRYARNGELKLRCRASSRVLPVVKRVIYYQPVNITQDDMYETYVCGLHDLTDFTSTYIKIYTDDTNLTQTLRTLDVEVDKELESIMICIFREHGDSLLEDEEFQQILQNQRTVTIIFRGLI